MRKSLSPTLREKPRQFKPDCVCSCRSAEDGRRIILEPTWLRNLSLSLLGVSRRLRGAQQRMPGKTILHAQWHGSR